MWRALFRFAGGPGAGAGSAFRLPCAFAEGFVPVVVLDDGGSALGTRLVDTAGDIVVCFFFRELLEGSRSGPGEATSRFSFLITTEGGFLAGEARGFGGRVSPD